MAIDTSALRHFAHGSTAQPWSSKPRHRLAGDSAGALASLINWKRSFDSAPATNMGEYARGQSSLTVNQVPSGFGSSNLSLAHHAAIVQWQNLSLPTRKRRIVTDWPLQFALLANLVIASA